MSSEAQRYRLGIFVISGVALTVVGVAALSAGRLFQETYPLYCYFQESVQGLEPGSPVKFRGVQIGRVEAVNLMPNSRIATQREGSHAESTIEVRSALQFKQITERDSAGDLVAIDTAIRREVQQGLRVSIAWKDITGQKYLDLDFVDPATSPPPALAFTPPGTYIPTAIETKLADIQRDVANVTSRLAHVDYQGIAQDARSAVVTLRKAIEDLDTKSLGAGFREAADSVRKLAANEDLAAALKRVDAVLEKAERAAAKLDEIASRPSVGAGLDDIAASAASLRRMTAQLEESIPRVTRSAEDTLASARTAIEGAKLAETTAAVRGTLSDVGNAARQVVGLREDGRRTLTDLGEASRGLARLVKFLEENPDALLRGKTERQ